MPGQGINFNRICAQTGYVYSPKNHFNDFTPKMLYTGLLKSPSLNFFHQINFADHLKPSPVDYPRRSITSKKNARQNQSIYT